MNIKNFGLITMMAMSLGLSATEVNHFEGKAVTDLKSALCNLQKYDPILAELTSKKDMSYADSAKVHELTYTLEKAVQKVQAEINIAVEELENAHKSSEVANSEKIRVASAKYLAITQMLVSTPNCK